MGLIYITDFHPFLGEIGTPDEVISLYQALMAHNALFQCEIDLGNGSLSVKSVKSAATILLQAQIVRDAFLFEIKALFTGGQDIDTWYEQHS